MKRWAPAKAPATQTMAALQNSLLVSGASRQSSDRPVFQEAKRAPWRCIHHTCAVCHTSHSSFQATSSRVWAARGRKRSAAKVARVPSTALVSAGPVASAGGSSPGSVRRRAEMSGAGKPHAGRAKGRSATRSARLVPGARERVASHTRCVAAACVTQSKVCGRRSRLPLPDRCLQRRGPRLPAPQTGRRLPSEESSRHA